MDRRGVVGRALHSLFPSTLTISFAVVRANARKRPPTITVAQRHDSLETLLFP
jgi:hypothetical protein